MPENKRLRICFDRIVPDSHAGEGSRSERQALRDLRTAIENHAPLMRGKDQSLAERAEEAHRKGLLDASHPIHVARMAVINRKKWENGHELRCVFLDGSTTQRKKVEDKAHLWEMFANVRVKFVTDRNSEVRISFHADDGSWSALGKDCLVKSYFRPGEPTMNFGWLEDDTEDTEYERVVVHEFGHALGCIHEHQSPKVKLDWDKDAVYAAFSGPPNNWSKAEIDSNILDKYSNRGISATQFDDKSIMLYQFDGELFLDGKPTPLNTHLSPLDKKMIAEMYPKAQGAAKK